MKRMSYSWKLVAIRLLGGLVALCLWLPGRLERIPAAFIAWRVDRRSRVLCAPPGNDAITVFVLSAYRFREDLAVLAETGQLRLIEAPTGVLQAVNSMFRSVPSLASYDTYEYYLESDPSCLAAREREAAFCATIWRALVKRMALDCALTPAVHYQYEYPWARAAAVEDFPFIAMHKEFTVIDHRHLPERIDRYRNRRFRFQGSHVLVTNANARTLFAEGGVFDAEGITVTGLPRMDRLFRADSPWRRKQIEGLQITLFSFGHFCGGLGPILPRRAKLFSAEDREGFVELFRAVHGAIAELAVVHPEVRFKIKPKSYADWWIAEIDAMVREAVGKGLDALPNCEVVNEMAPDLIRDSEAVIGFNSTVLLESLALGRPTIMPLFAEAVEKYPDNVFLRDHLQSFITPGSKQELVDLLERAIAGALVLPEAGAASRRACMNYYLGFSDGRSAERVVKALRGISAGELVAEPSEGAPAPARVATA